MGFFSPAAGLLAAIVCCASLTARARSAPQPAQASPPPGTQSAPTAANQAAQSAFAGEINQNENARKARALLNAAIQALGGQAYLHIQDMEEEGKSYAYDHGESGFGLPFWLFWKFPDKERAELTKQRDVVYIYNGDHGYEKTFKGTRRMTDKEMADYRAQRNYTLDLVLRQWAPDPAVALFYEGQTVALNLAADQVSLMNTRNQTVTLYLDARTHLPLKESFTVRNPQGDHDTYDETYSNYQPVQGVETPMATSRFHNGEQTRQRFLTRVRYNTGVADALFNATVTYDPDAKRRH